MQDCTLETLQHIKAVANNMTDFSISILQRAKVHDDSKLCSPEKEIFDEYTPILNTLEYGSPEYKENLEKIKPAIDHHYKCNSHHPEFYNYGVDDMTLEDIVEMYCDWKAAVSRTKDGNFEKSLQINEKRFCISPQLIQIFRNTYNKNKK